MYHTVVVVEFLFVILFYSIESNDKMKIDSYAQAEVSSDSWQDSLLNVSLVFGFFLF